MRFLHGTVFFYIVFSVFSINILDYKKKIRNHTKRAEQSGSDDGRAVAIIHGPANPRAVRRESILEGITLTPLES
jgi:hypothetical protein